MKICAVLFAAMISLLAFTQDTELGPRFIFLKNKDGKVEPKGAWIPLKDPNHPEIEYKLPNGKEIEIIQNTGSEIQFKVLNFKTIPSDIVFSASTDVFKKYGQFSLEKDSVKITAVPPKVETLVSERPVDPNDTRPLDKQGGCYDSRSKTFKTYKVAFTFDDGPAQKLYRPLATDKVVQVLKEKGDIKTVFFISGEKFGKRKDAIHHDAAYYDQQFSSQIKGGHALGNHTWDHDKASSFGTSDAEWEENALLPLAEYGEHLIPATRLPYGEQADIDNEIDGTGKIPLMLKHKMIPEWWDIDSEDYTHSAEDQEMATKKIIARVLQEICTKRGGIILMHDVHPTTANALGALIDTLRAEGHVIVNPMELRPQWADKKLNEAFQVEVQKIKKDFAARLQEGGKLFPEVYDRAH